MTYYKISNADGKQWVMSSKNMAMGMQLYQPSAWKGRLLKQWLPLVNKVDVLGVVKKALNIEVCECPIPETLKKKLKEVFGRNDLEYSYFGGTPCAHQKATIQVYSKDQIFGYCKITKNEEIFQLFKHEQNILNTLDSFGVKNIPRCLYCGGFVGEMYLFIQTTRKTSKSNIRHELGYLELCFLKRFKEFTSQQCSLKETDEYKWLLTLRDLEDKLSCISVNGRSVVKNGVKLVCDYYGEQISAFSAYHSDFTPWNMFEESDELFVFDFEYAGLTYIPYLDLFHHFTQTGIFEQKLGANALYKSYCNKMGFWESYFDSPDVAYLAYLLDQLAKFIGREKGKMPETLIKTAKIWITLIELLQHNNK